MNAPARPSPLRLALRAQLRDDERATPRHPHQARSTNTKTDATWGQFKPSRRGHCKPSRRALAAPRPGHSADASLRGSPLTKLSAQTKFAGRACQRAA